MKNKVFLIFCFLIFNSMLLKAQNEKFDEFIDKFTEDTLFQFSRIHFPLPYITWDYENDDNEVIYSISKEKYKFNPLYGSLAYEREAYSVFYDNFNCEFRDTGEMVFRWVGFTDMDIRYYFKRIDGKWYLIKISSPDPFE